MELILLRFLRSIRTGDFSLYLHTLEEMNPWFFALDKYRYAKWSSVHLYDMKRLHLTNPDDYQAFKELGCFVVSRTRNSFSSMGLDERHEQQNKDVKGDGDFLGLTKNEEKLRRWMIMCT